MEKKSTKHFIGLILIFSFVLLLFFIVFLKPKYNGYVIMGSTEPGYLSLRDQFECTTTESCVNLFPSGENPQCINDQCIYSSQVSANDEGDLSIVISDNADRTSNEDYYYTATNGKIFQLSFANDGEHPHPGKIKILEGVVSYSLKNTGKNDILVNSYSYSENNVFLSPNPQTSQTTQGDGGDGYGTIASSIGPRNLLALVINYQDQNATFICTQNYFEQAIFNVSNSFSTNHFFSEMSSQNPNNPSTYFNGTFAGTFTIPCTTNGNCTLSDVITLTDTMAEAAGFNMNVSANQNRIYIIPSSVSSFPWMGIADLGYPGVYTPPNITYRAIVKGCSNPSIIAHELGHNLGMMHASNLSAEYGDLSDVMGEYVVLAVLPKKVNAPHMEVESWIPPGNILNVVSNGTYTITELHPSSLTNSTQILKIAKLNINESYYFSFRTESNLPQQYVNKTNVHLWNGTFWHNTYYLSSLTDNLSFVDSVNGITVTQINHTATSATLNITLLSPPSSLNVPSPPSGLNATVN